MKKKISIVFVLLGIGLIVFCCIACNKIKDNIEEEKKKNSKDDIVIECSKYPSEDITVVHTLTMTYDHKPKERENLIITDYSKETKERLEEACKDVYELTDESGKTTSKAYCKDKKYHSSSILHYDKLEYSEFDKDTFKDDLQYMKEDKTYDYDSYMTNHDNTGFRCKIN